LTTVIHTSHSQSVLYIKAGATSMAGAWFKLRPVWPMRGLYKPKLNAPVKLSVSTGYARLR